MLCNGFPMPLVVSTNSLARIWEGEGYWRSEILNPINNDSMVSNTLRGAPLGGEPQGGTPLGGETPLGMGEHGQFAPAVRPGQLMWQLV